MIMENGFKPEAKKFIQAFMSAWSDVLKEREGPLRGADLTDFYSSPRGWTEVMLARPDENGSPKSTGSKREGVLGSALERYGNLERKYEWNKYDLLGVRRVTELPNGLSDKGKNEYWLKFVEVAIEHENGDDVETEIWKLCQLRAKLKVLVFYDFAQKYLAHGVSESNYSDPSFDRALTKREWLGKKKELLGKIVAGANEVLPNEDAEYVLIVGSRAETGTILWRASAFQKDAFSAFISIERE
jgi:hypothetical protein